MKSLRTTGDLLNVLVDALDAADWSIEPGSVDTQGLSLSVHGELYRLRITPESRLYPTQDAYERHDAFIGETDPCGFNGMEGADDVEF